MSRGRLSIHLPRVAALILSMVAAAGSYSVHADQSVGSREEARDQLVGPAADAGKARVRTRSHARKRGHGRADRTIRRARTRSGAAHAFVTLAASYVDGWNGSNRTEPELAATGRKSLLRKRGQ